MPNGYHNDINMIKSRGSKKHSPNNNDQVCTNQAIVDSELPNRDILVYIFSREF